MEGKEGLRPPISLKGKVVRALAGLGIVFSIGAGTEAATGGAVSKIPGNMAQVGKELAKGALTATGDLLDKNNSITEGQVDQIRQNLQQRAVKDQAEGVTTGLKPTK